MKKIGIALMLMSLTLSAYTQQDEKVTVSTKDLTTTQLQKIEADRKIEELQKKLTTYGNWVGVGGEIGTAMKEGLTAVVEVSDKFSKTDVGKFTMIMIAYKILGRDFIRIAIGLLFFLTFTVFIFRAYRNAFVPRKVLIEGNPWFFWQNKKYQVIESEHYEGIEAVKVLYIVLMLGGFGLTYAIMFA